MAEGLGVAASAIAVVELSAKITLLCSQYLKDVKNAESDIVKLEKEVSNLKAVSESVRQLLDTPHGGRLKTSQELRTTLENGQIQLQILKDTLHSHREKNKKWRKLRSLKWPFKSGDIMSLVHDLARYTQVISLSLQVNQTITILDMDQKMVLDKLPVVEGATFDSHAEEHNPTCLQGTRTDILQIIQIWADTSEIKPLLWVNGMAGTGKSTISRTAARFLSESGQLGASFFFKRGEVDRSSISKFFPTIAAQLVKKEPALAPHIKEIIDNDSSIFGKRIEEQFEKLVRDPLSKAPKDKRENEILVIVIDALDECEREEDIRLLIRLLFRFNDQQFLKLRIFLTSRPELPIRLGFRTFNSGYLDIGLHKYPESTVQHDLMMYFTQELAKIRDDYNNTVIPERKLPLGWPEESVITELAKIASPLFIFAATTCRFLADRRNGTPDTKLQRVLEYKTRSQESKLDATYLPVLYQMVAGLSNREEDEAWEEFQAIVGSIIVLFDPLSTSALAGILGILQDKIDARLDLLHSVLSIPSSPNLPVKLFHLSFRDFLLDPEKRERDRFWIDEKLAHRQLAKGCLHILSKSLRKDICELRWPGTTLESIDPQVIKEKLPPEVQYACRYWALHLKDAGDLIHDGDQVHNFLKLHLLHWLEALVLVEGTFGTARTNLEMLRSIIPEKYASELLDLVDDSMSFIYILPRHHVPLQLYSEAALRDRKFKHLYKSDLPSWMLPGPELETSIDQSRFYGVSHIRLAISSDLKLLAGILDGLSILAWSVDTGDLRHTLKGHSGQIKSIAFSPDARLLASAAIGDQTVRIWSMETGDCLRVIPLSSTTNFEVSFDREGLFVLTDTDAIPINDNLQLVCMDATSKEPFVPESDLVLVKDTTNPLNFWISIGGLGFYSPLDTPKHVAIAGSVVALYDYRAGRVVTFLIITEKLLELRPGSANVKFS